MKLAFLFIMLISFFSCGKSTDQKVADAIDQAQTYLSDGDCDKALKVLDDVGAQKGDPIYLQVFASAYACKADFDMIVFISRDLDNISSSSFSALMKSLSIMTLSKETSADSDAFVAMKTGIGILLQDSASVQPSQVMRTSKFGPRKAGDMGMETLIYSLVELGKFLTYYGNVSSTGVKGQGTQTNKCFIDYTYSQAQTVRAAGGGSCNTNTGGHADLTLARRRCEGLMLFTNILDILNNLDVSGNDTFSSLSSVASQANTFVTAAKTTFPQIKTLLETTSQIKCESLLQSSSEADNMQLIYAALFETGLQ